MRGRSSYSELPRLVDPPGSSRWPKRQGCGPASTSSIMCAAPRRDPSERSRTLHLWCPRTCTIPMKGMTMPWQQALCCGREAGQLPSTV